jgi:hypothetical protein
MLRILPPTRGKLILNEEVTGASLAARLFAHTCSSPVDRRCCFGSGILFAGRFGGGSKRGGSFALWLSCRWTLR